MLEFTKGQQFLHEIIGWKRLLEFYSGENIFLKTRLSEVLDRKTDSLFLRNAEYFHNEFIAKDDYLQVVRMAMKDQEMYLKNVLLNKLEPDGKITNRQQKIRNKIDSLEFDFPNLKNQFNQYLLSLV